MFYGSMPLFIHSYPGAVLGFLFVTGLSEKSYKVLHTLSMVFFQNVSGIPNNIYYPSIRRTKRTCRNHYKFFFR
ncbi:hypothetical protein COC96_19490 [Bacillus cereus]|nr:hypothetical protein COC96_19490 [Bacillus cereus]